MNNFDGSTKLLRKAEEYYEDVLNAFDRKSWDTVVRRSQEVVETSLKSILKATGVEYPKVHEVGTIFEKIAKEKSLGVEENILAEVKGISVRLSRERAPAFYAEKEHSKEEAESARKSAEKVLKFAKMMVKVLNKG